MRFLESLVVNLSVANQGYGTAFHEYPSGPAALAAYCGVQLQGASSSMRLIL